MLCHIAVAIGLYFDDRQTMAPHGAAQLLAKGIPIPGPGMRRTKEPCRRGNIETGGRPEERFECCRVKLLGLRKK